MGRRTEFQANGHTIAAGVAQTIVWQSSELPMADVVTLLPVFQGGTTLADVTRIRVKSAGSTIIDIPPNKLRSWVQRTSPANLLIAATASAFPIPLNWLEQPTEEAQDLCAMPRGAGLSVEIQLAATASAGSAIMGWEVTDVASTMSPVYLSTAMGIPLGATEARYNFSAPGVLAGVSLPSRGIGKARVIVGNVEQLNLTGPVFGGTDAAPGAGFDMLNRIQSPQGAILIAGLASGEQYLSLPPSAAPQGSSYILLDTPDVTTGANDWGGLGEEIGLFSLVRQPQAAR